MNIKRDLWKHLEHWRTQEDRKPILLRGARQVGKSFLVREFGQEFDRFVEVNFEFEAALREIFDRDLNPSRIVRDLSIATGTQITPGQTLLFLDEIQECPLALRSLRYFYEKLPNLHVIAAGSLVDFALEKAGVPVGRLSFLHLYPVSFLEYLSATENAPLREAIESPIIWELPLHAHNKLVALLGEYLAVGGMPEAVSTWIKRADLDVCARIHQNLVNAFKQDFAKYARKNQQEYVEIVFSAIPRLLGQKFIYHAVSPDVRSRSLKPSLDLMSKAQIAHVVQHTSANGVPLGAEANPKQFKVLFLDFALAQSLLGLNLGKWVLNPKGAISNRGAIAEAFVGQEILAYGDPAARGELYYWTREKRASLAEVDYVEDVNGKIVPIEVKSGRTGSMKSLRLFLEAKQKSGVGVRFSLGQPRKDDTICSLPLYAVGSLRTVFP